MQIEECKLCVEGARPRDWMPRAVFLSSGLGLGHLQLANTLFGQCHCTWKSAPNRPCLPHPCLAFSLRLRALLLCSQAAAAMEVKSSEQVLPFKTAILSPLCRRAVWHWAVCLEYWTWAQAESGLGSGQPQGGNFGHLSCVAIAPNGWRLGNLVPRTRGLSGWEYRAAAVTLAWRRLWT